MVYFVRVLDRVRVEVNRVNKSIDLIIQAMYTPDLPFRILLEVEVP